MGPDKADWAWCAGWVACGISPFSATNTVDLRRCDGARTHTCSCTYPHCSVRFLQEPRLALPLVNDITLHMVAQAEPERGLTLHDNSQEKDAYSSLYQDPRRGPSGGWGVADPRQRFLFLFKGSCNENPVATETLQCARGGWSTCNASKGHCRKID